MHSSGPIHTYIHVAESESFALLTITCVPPLHPCPAGSLCGRKWSRTYELDAATIAATAHEL
jgi:hypothetical protein